MTYPFMISYAQNGEDVVLRRAFADRETPGFYIDVGACHPIEDSVTAYFYERGWRGINVEPDPELFKLFLAARPRDINVNVAVDLNAASVEFFPMSVRGHGTLDAAYAAEADDVSVRVPSMSLSGLVERYRPPDVDIAFLKIDVEGWERQVVRGMDWRRYRPLIVLVEAVDPTGHPNHDSWEQDLISAGYRFILFDGLNRFYCRDEDAERLLPLLSPPANVLDNWVRNAQVRLEQANESLSRANEEAARANTLALSAVSLKSAELERAQQEAARALERERVAEETLAELELRSRVEAEVAAHECEIEVRDAKLAEQRRMRILTGFFKRMLRRS